VGSGEVSCESRERGVLRRARTGFLRAWLAGWLAGEVRRPTWLEGRGREEAV
jgi:hypothetical protein